ncbi:DNA polymerase III subunit delta [Gemmatimonas sp.]|uniref:DNA polymerase III subunit delta n=1 Tax=Gemmatimonas sp. TaxID=1962908 RepID=UPI0022C3197B|nr:DNA polymerase III subunit delta [Gemmatimonas sp.]MCA2986278.1 DNA polymerase III subunit delta [Gemmatimonas sp.]MCA2991535.1 DNA polymerase III subunit delta [Gemmatimonas sp.]MCZ8013724.1 DNA polymerase III subunit delta [Gemmatimonas sp.]MCZ8267557.1 DNA polymerase III subunit delta [Gemmatimonas sp.]
MPPKSSATPPKESAPLRVVQAAVQSRQFAPVYYLHGDDDFLKDGALHDLLQAAIDPSTRDFNLEQRRGSDLDAESVASLLTTPPMLAERRAVVLRDVTGLKKAARVQLDKYLERPAGDTLLLLVSPAGTKADPALLHASVSLEFAPLTPERVRRWITHHATTVLQVDIADDAAQLLQQAVGNDLHLLAAELDKCASYELGMHDDIGAPHGGAPRATIGVEAVSAVVGVRRGETVTDLLDAVARHDAQAAVQLVPHVLSQPKMSAVQVVMMLGTQAFALSFGRARRDAGVPTPRLPQEYFAFLKDTGGYPGRPWGEAASAWTRATDGWSAEACARALALLLEADTALKDTRVSNEEQLLTSLVLALCATRSRRAA